MTLDEVPQEVITDCAQLVKANSIEGVVKVERRKGWTDDGREGGKKKVRE